MFKHHLVPNLIGICKQHRIALIILLIFIVGGQNVYPQQQIALDTYAIFQQSCLICHGPDGAYKESLLMEHNALIEKGSVVPGNPDVSELYSRSLTTDTAKRMPLGQPQSVLLSRLTQSVTGYWLVLPIGAVASYNRWRLHLS